MTAARDSRLLQGPKAQFADPAGAIVHHLNYYSADGAGLPALGPGIPFHRIRSEEVIVGANDDPWLQGADAGETAGPGERLW